MWSQFTNVTDGQTDRHTDRQTTCDRNTALCTKVHRAVKTNNKKYSKHKTTLVQFSHLVHHTPELGHDVGPTTLRSPYETDGRSESWRHKNEAYEGATGETSGKECIVHSNLAECWQALLAPQWLNYSTRWWNATFLPSLSFPSSILSPPFPPIPLSNRPAPFQLQVLGERCNLPLRGLGQSPSRNSIWCI